MNEDKDRKELTTPLPPNNVSTERKPEPVIKKASVTAPAMVKSLTPENLRQLPPVKACDVTNVTSRTFQQQLEHAANKVSLIRTQLTQAQQLLDAQRRFPHPNSVARIHRRDEEVSTPSLLKPVKWVPKKTLASSPVKDGAKSPGKIPEQRTTTSTHESVEIEPKPLCEGLSSTSNPEEPLRIETVMEGDGIPPGYNPFVCTDFTNEALLDAIAQRAEERSGLTLILC